MSPLIKGRGLRVYLHTAKAHGRETLGGRTEYCEELRGGVLSGWQLRGEGPEWKGGFMDVIKLNDRSALHIKMLLFVVVGKHPMEHSIGRV